MLRYLVRIVCLGLSFFSSVSARAYYSSDTPAHHQFNARLLNPNELEVSLLGNVRYGVNEQVEVGFNLPFALGGGYFLNLKHEMFRIDQSQTSFTSFAIIMNGPETRLLMAPVGVVTSYHLLDKPVLLNFGLFDMYVSVHEKAKSESSESINVDLSAHVFSPMVGADWLISRGLSFSAFTLLPLYGNFEGETDYADVSAQFHWYKGDGGSYPMLAYAAFTLAWETFSLEYGLLRVAQTNLPYVNVVWRFL